MSENSSKSWLWIPIAVALIGCMATICAAVIGILPALIKLSPEVVAATPVVGTTQVGPQSDPTNNTFATPVNQLVNRPPYLVIAVGVSDQTALKLVDAKTYDHKNGTYFEVNTVAEAIDKLSEVYQPSDTIYVVHLPNLFATPDNPGSCKLLLNQAGELENYPLGWIMGGSPIIPTDKLADLHWCFG
ncbi:MAG: hypothetical protein KA338_08250 [Chloroflexi bacterium]|nr:hypothetical protein [Chloroflexota bacterium]